MNESNGTQATDGDVLRELRGRNQVFSFRLGSEQVQRKTLECRAADEIQRLRKFAEDEYNRGYDHGRRDGNAEAMPHG